MTLVAVARATAQAGVGRATAVVVVGRATDGGAAVRAMGVVVVARAKAGVVGGALAEVAGGLTGAE